MIRTIIQIDEEKCNGCGGLETAAKRARQASGKMIPWQVATISLDGQTLERQGGEDGTSSLGKKYRAGGFLY